MFFVLIAINLLFIYFFYSIGFLYGIYIVSLFFLFFIVLSLFSKTWQSWIKFFVKFVLLEYAMYINFFIILCGFYFLSNYFFQQSYGIWLQSSLSAIFFVLGIWTVFALFSSFLARNDLIKLSYFAIFVAWIYIYFLLKNLDVFEYFVSFTLSVSVVSHLLYFVRTSKYNYFLLYIVFLSGIISLFFLIKNTLNLEANMLSLIVQVIVFIILSYTLYVKNLYKHKKELEELMKTREYEIWVFWYSDIEISKEEDSEYKDFVQKRDYYDTIMSFFVNSPSPVKIIFALTNSIPVFFASWFFFHNLQSWANILNEIVYRLGWLVFFVNFILFKKLDWFVMIQRVFAFFVINFVTYFTIIDFMWQNYFYIAIWWIVWNLLTTSLIIFIWDKWWFLQAVDYLTWSFINFLGVWLNIYFLLKIWLNLYFVSWIIFLYIWLYIALYRLIYKKYFNL